MGEKENAEEVQPDKIDESAIATADEESIIQSSEETRTEVQEVAYISGFRINECGEIIRENNGVTGIILDKDIDNEISQSTPTDKKLEQLQPIKETQPTNIWKSRFQNWYGAIDRVSQNSKGKFLKMKANIVKAISDKIKLRDNNRNIDNQEKDI